MTKFSKFKSNINLPDTDDYESPIRLFNKVSDQNLFNVIDQEQMKIAGSPLLIFKYYQTVDIDDVYGPRPVEENLTQFGIELTNDQQFTFNKSYIEKKLGRAVMPGDIIKPEFQNLKYEVFEVQEDSFEMYGVYHLLCSAKLLRDSDDVHKQIVPTSDQINSKVEEKEPYE
jgi:hypothetical protein